MKINSEKVFLLLEKKLNLERAQCIYIFLKKITVHLYMYSHAKIRMQTHF